MRCQSVALSSVIKQWSRVRRRVADRTSRYNLVEANVTGVSRVPGNRQTSAWSQAALLPGCIHWDQQIHERPTLFAENGEDAFLPSLKWVVSCATFRRCVKKP